MNIHVGKDKTSTLTLTQTIFRFNDVNAQYIQVILDLVLPTWDSKWTVSAKKDKKSQIKKLSKCNKTQNNDFEANTVNHYMHIFLKIAKS